MNTTSEETKPVMHTPGPWHYQEKADRYTHIVRSGGSDLGNFFVCQLGQDTSGVAEANARLIAAAPELLEALKTAREYVQAAHGSMSGAMGHNDTIVKPDLDAIDTAIAKAEGRE